MDESGQLVSTMAKHFTPKEARAVLEQSRRLLDDEPIKDKQSVPEPPPLVIETQEQRWYREANEDIARREAAAAERRAAEQAAADLRNATQRAADSALESRVASLEERVASLESQISQLASGSIEFSNATVTALRGVQDSAAELGRLLKKLQVTHAREVDSLRARLTSSELIHQKEVSLFGKQLDDVRREAAALNDQREREQDSAKFEIINSNIIEMHRAVVALRAREGDG
jgi:hypothetical protein